MDRRLSIAAGALVLASAGVILWRGKTKRASDAPTAIVSVVSDASVTASFDAGLGVMPGADAATAAAPLDAPPGTRLPDGSPVPALPEKAPKAVRFGVVLVTYAGAQGAASTARSKKEALAVAEKLAADAKVDFKAAVGRGDSGGAEDVGRVPRGVLEPAPEYVLFTMAAGSISDPIDTPRGYWVVKRID